MTVLNADFIADPYPKLARMGPVERCTTPEGTTVWLVTRYADVRASLADPRLSLDSRNANGEGDYGSSLPAQLGSHLLNLDPPDHTRLRRLVAKAFTARQVEQLRGSIQATVDRLLDAIRLPADLMSALAAPLPMAVICDLLGITPADRAEFRGWTSTLLDPDPAAPQRSRVAMTAMHDFLVSLLDRKRAAPEDDLLSALIAVRDQGDELTGQELVALAFLVLFGGYDTSANLIGNTVYGLLAHPPLLASVRSGEIEIADVIEESLRWITPFQFAVRRFPTEDIEIGGVRIPAGERVWLCLAAANRDPAQFDQPDELRPARASNAHLSFGHGAHFCFGAPLARLQAQIAVTSLLNRFPDITLAGEVRWRNSFRTRGPRLLPVHSPSFVGF